MKCNGFRGLPLALMLGLLTYSMTSSTYAAGTYELRYDETDFESPQAVIALHKKIRREARDYCRAHRVLRDLRGNVLCVNDVVNDLVEKIDHSLLHAYVHGERELEVAFSEQHRGEDKG